jgi:hypothetical protein
MRSWSARASSAFGYQPAIPECPNLPVVVAANDELEACAMPSGVQPVSHQFAELQTNFNTQFGRCAQ